MQNVVHRYATTAGTLTQAPGGKIGGVLTDRLDLKVADPVEQRRRQRRNSCICRKKRIGRFAKSSTPARRSFSTKASPTLKRTSASLKTTSRFNPTSS